MSIFNPVAVTYLRMTGKAMYLNLTRNVLMRKLILNSLLAATLSASSLFAIADEVKTAPDHAAQAVAVMTQSAVNINTADTETLARELNGVGAAKARAIVEYREAHGEFASVDELLEVKGIGIAIMEKNLNKLTVK